uniref:Alternative protein C13orf38 n=1 Tax=Homo sapiens TaxID=9606 RepID=L8E9U4_HUMAN|nr:alternative protein C13orf38 [Homo sapiens]
MPRTKSTLARLLTWVLNLGCVSDSPEELKVKYSDMCTTPRIVISHVFL